MQLSVLGMSHKILRLTCVAASTFTQNRIEPFPGEKVTRKKRVKVTEMLEIICTCQSIGGGNIIECKE